MVEQDRREEVVAVARTVLEHAAPDQLPEFETYARAWLADPERALGGDTRRDRPLGSGIHAELPNLIPMILFVVHHVLDATVAVGFEEGVRRGASKVLGLRRKKAEAARSVATDDPAEIRRKAVSAGEEFGARAEDVTLVADIVVVVVTAEFSSQSAPAIPKSESENAADS